MSSSIDSASTSADQKKPALNNSDENVLKKHVAFFDLNNDGIVYPWETYQGFRKIGAGVLLSAAAAIFINAGFSAKTRPGKMFSILLPVAIENINLAKHGSDTDVYDNQGRFVPAKFEEIFAKHAHTNPDYLTSEELNQLLKANREPKDFGGWIAAFGEWKILYILAKDSMGVLRKETVRGVYDGSLFEQLEKAHASKKKQANKASEMK